ncbi:MAG TPA: peptidylprolyl isomerase [Terracidiphilus sp.]|nr:peptidylprolyl isomerase [Terracidiphilus sp.]
MTLRLLRIPAVFALSAALLAVPALAQSGTSAPASPYGGRVVERIIARVNDRIITTTDYERAEKELNQEGRQNGASMQEMADSRRNLLRNLIDQQLWLSKGKQLGITGETDLINRLNEIRKQYHLASLEDLQKAAEQQGVSYEDFKANIRNQIVTQSVMRQEVGSHISVAPGEVRRFYDEHKQEYSQPESVRLSEILISTDKAAPAQAGGAQPTEAERLADAEAKTKSIEAKLQAGGNFSELAKAFSDGPTASQGGDLGTYKHGELASVFEDKAFPLKTGQWTEPIRTRQGFVILKVVQHNAGGIQPFKNVEQDVEQAYFMSKMEPATRAYLTQMRDEAYLEIAPGYVDTGASPNKRVFPIAYSAYAPPSPKKKRKIERTRFRETGRSFRHKEKAPPLELAADQAPKTQKESKKHGKKKEVSMKPGKKEKIRFGRAPQETLPNSPTSQTEDAGAMPREAVAPQPDLVEEGAVEQNVKPTKTRFSDLARKQKGKTQKKKAEDFSTVQPPTAAEAADRQLQSAPLGLGDNVEKKKKKGATTSTEKTRYSDEMRKPKEKEAKPQPTPIPPVPGAPAPATAPQQ